MACNRVEALSAKSIADEKFEKKDYIGAQKLAFKAETMCPGIKSVQKMLAETNVLISAEKKISTGEIDWYVVLSVDPSANRDIISSRCRDLVLQLYPDTNECPGKDHTALQLVLEGWRLLKDQLKRSAYDQRRVSQQRFPVGPPAPASATGFTAGGPSAPPPPPSKADCSQKSINKGKAKASRAQKPPKGTSTKACSNRFAADPFTFTSSNANADPPAPAPDKADGSHKPTRGKATVKKTKASPNTFWTMCTKCEYHYEYENIYKNHPLRCVNCEAVFRASELDRSLVPKKHKRVVKKNSRASTSAAAKDLKKSE